MSAPTNPSLDAALALHRFGFGPRDNAISKLAADPRGALLAELDHPGAATIQDPNLLDTGEAARAVFDFRQERKAVRFAERADQMMTANGNAAPAATAPRPRGPALPQQISLAEAKAHFDRALDAETGFIERLVWFWSNHFCVSADKIRSMSGAYEREAIRPHMLGRFTDLLLAAEGHPAMLFYLDQTISMGANSIAGINRTRG